MWTDAFINFIGVFCSVHKDRCSELLKHMYTIRLGANRSACHGWVHYDEHIRLRKTLNPSSSWAVVYTELWLLYMNSSDNIYGSGGSLNIGNSTIVNKGGQVVQHVTLLTMVGIAIGKSVIIITRA